MKNCVLILAISISTLSLNAFAAADEIPSLVKVEANYLYDAAYPDDINRAERIQNLVQMLGCWPTDQQMMSAGLMEYLHINRLSVSLRAGQTITLKKNICQVEGRSPFLTFDIIAAGDLDIKLMSPSGVSKEILRKDLGGGKFAYYKKSDGSTIDASGQNGWGDLRMEKGAWTLQITAKRRARIEEIKWSSQTLFGHTAPN